MSDVTDPTQPMTDATTDAERSPRTGEGVRADPARRDGRDLPDPVEVFKTDDNRIKLLLAIAGMQLIAVLLLLAVLVSVRGGEVGEPVEVEGQPCVVVEEEGGNALYCRR